MTRTPTNSRYIPFTQQPYCCTPASMLMVMYKLGLPLVSQEELGYHLGLTVPPEEKNLFWNVRVSDAPPTAAGYGTQIQKAEFDPNKAFKKLGIPLKFIYNLIDNFDTAEQARAYLKDIEQNDRDVMICFATARCTIPNLATAMRMFLTATYPIRMKSGLSIRLLPFRNGASYRSKSCLRA